MTSRERLLRTLNNQPTDRIPWAPNMAYWWDFHDDARKMGEVNFLESIDADCLIRGHYPIEPNSTWQDLLLFRDSTPHCTVEERFLTPEKKQIVYTTPVGTLVAEYTYLVNAKTWFLSKHPVETEEDFLVLKCYKEDLEIVPDYTKYTEKLKEYGDRCLMVPLLNRDMKTAFQSLIEYWVGLENLVYALADFPETVDSVWETMVAVNKRYAQISAGAQAPFYTSWEDSSTTMISPALYEQYVAPEIDAWCEILHRRGCRYMQHACGTLRNLAPIMKETGIDAIESASPPPTGDIELWELSEALGNRIRLVGGIEPTNFEKLRGDAFSAYVQTLLLNMKGRCFVLANSDSCPPGVPLENFRIVSDLVRKTDA